MGKITKIDNETVSESSEDIIYNKKELEEERTIHVNQIIWEQNRIEKIDLLLDALK